MPILGTQDQMSCFPLYENFLAAVKGQSKALLDSQQLTVTVSRSLRQVIFTSKNKSTINIGTFISQLSVISVCAFWRNKTLFNSSFKAVLCQKCSVPRKPYRQVSLTALCFKAPVMLIAMWHHIHFIASRHTTHGQTTYQDLRQHGR